MAKKRKKQPRATRTILEQPELGFGKAYIVEISFAETNPIHRAMMTSVRGNGDDRSGEFHSSGYEAPQSRLFISLAYLRIIKEIPEFDEKYPNQWKMPRDTPDNLLSWRKQHEQVWIIDDPLKPSEPF